MKFTLDWLKEHLDTKHNDEEIMDLGFVVLGLGFMFSGLGFVDWGLGFEVLWLGVVVLRLGFVVLGCGSKFWDQIFSSPKMPKVHF